MGTNTYPASYTPKQVWGRHPLAVAFPIYVAMIFLLMGMTTPLPAKQTPAAGPLRVLSENPRYFTADGERAVYLTDATGTLAVEWFDPRGRTTESVGTVDGGGKRTFRNPFLQDAVLYLKVPL